MLVDLHCHTTASDGALSPGELYARAASCKVDLLAITDHDTLDGYLSLRSETELCSSQEPSFRPKLISGIELSSACSTLSIDNVHIVGLNLNCDDLSFQQFLSSQQNRRYMRAEAIAKKVEALGIEDVLSKVRRIAGVMDGQSSQSLGRPHFAKLLIEEGYSRTMQQAFTRYLGQGKRCYVGLQWPTMEEVIAAIQEAGGLAVLAHPNRYRLTRTKRNKLITAFAEQGGAAIELISGQQTGDITADLAQIAQRLDLAVSVGSDFHSPDPLINELGCIGVLENTVHPELARVWDLFDFSTERK